MSDRKTEEGPASEEVACKLKPALRRIRGAVALITSCCRGNVDVPAGPAASAVIPTPMAVMVNRSASAHTIIERCGRFCINLLGTAQTALGRLFSNGAMRDQRFASDEWRRFSDDAGKAFKQG